MSNDIQSAVIFDLDGTVYLGDSLIAGAQDVVTSLRDSGTAVRFLTNKAIDRRSDYSQKLSKLGIPTAVDEVINSGWVTAQYLKRNHPDREALVIGEDPLVEELEDAGIATTTERPGELVVASMDRTFTYRKLELALETLQSDVPFLATNPDRTCPMPDGEIPDAAGMIGAIEGVTGKSVDEILGKPSPTMVETILAELDVPPDECLMVGDRPETDIVMGNRAGMETALVLSGVTERPAVESIDADPDHVIESIAELTRVLERPTVVTDE